jgi:acyl-CoA thioesterase FadM
MARVKLVLPEKFCYTTELEIRISDVNYGGHLGNDAVLALAHEARMRFLASIGCSEFDAGGEGLIMTDAVVVYKSQGEHGMKLKAEIAVDDMQMTGFDLYYRFTDKESQREIARVKTGMAFFSYERKRPVKTPDTFKDKLKSINAI